MRISDWSSDVCSSDLGPPARAPRRAPNRGVRRRAGWSSRSAGRSRRRVRLHCGLLGNPAPELRRGPGPQLTLEQLGVGIAGQRLISDQDLAGPLVGRQFLMAQPLDLVGGEGRVVGEIGRAWSMERVCLYGWIRVVAVSLKKK